MKVKPVLRKYTTRSLWSTAAAGKDWLLDTADAILGRRHELVPPRRLIFVGSGRFVEIGNEFLEHFKQLVDLKPNHRVLDVGCGIGRMAIPLTKYLSAEGSYDGFDIVPQGIAWCHENLTRRYHNFRFHLADIRNAEYNPKGTVTAGEYRFPYAERSFDVVFLTSVFTHLLPIEVANYLTEIARVLKPGGRCLTTWFLLNGTSKALLEQGRSAMDFRYPVDGCLTTNPTVSEYAIAYEEHRVQQLHSRAGLVLEHPVRYGSWCGRSEYLSFQDICIARN
jgi:SAM-dependent methyltransferase